MPRKVFLTFSIALLCFSIFKVSYAQTEPDELDEVDPSMENADGGIVVDTFATIDLGEDELGEDDFNELDDENVDPIDEVDNVDDTPTTDNNTDEVVPDVTVNPDQPDETPTETEGNGEQDDGTQDDLTDDDGSLVDPVVDDGSDYALNGKVLKLCGTFVLAAAALAI